jgi:flagellar biosynthesis protein FlhB
MSGGKDNRSESPTRRRLEKAREKGQVARSKEVSLAAVLLGGLLILTYFGQTVLRAMEYEMRHIFILRLPPDLSIQYLSGLFSGIAVRIGIVLVPILLSVMVISVSSNLLQGGFVFSSQALGFKLSKLNPTNGLQRIFSKNGLVELLKSLILLFAVSLISYQVISKHLAVYPRLVLMDVRQLFHWTTLISYEVFIRVAVLLVCVAIVDYFFQKHRFMDQLKMTKQEVKEEFKESEGDPTTKGRIRRLQREMSRKRMMADVPTADVVITNPTHYAIALSYQMDSMEAPKVVAKGVGFLALKIRELAQNNGVPIVENKPLAQTLYKSVEIGEFIPAGLYKAVAEILAYIYKAKNALNR